MSRLPVVSGVCDLVDRVPWAGITLSLGVAAVLAPKVRSAQPFVVPVGQALVPMAGLVVAGLAGLGAVVTKKPAYVAGFAAGVWAGTRPWRSARAQQRRAAVNVLRRRPGGSSPALTGRAAQGGFTFTIVSVNVLYGRADPRTLARFATHCGADFVLVQECTEAFSDQLEHVRSPHRFGQVYPYRFGAPAPRAAGTVTYSKFPGVHLTDWLVNTAGVDDRHNPVVRFETPAGDLTISNVHTVPPAPHWATAWGRQLRRIRYHVRHTNGPLIVAGDFNADLCHPAFCDLTTSFQDGVDGVEVKPWSWLWRNTWPRGGKLEFVRLDHILGRDLSLNAGGTVSIPGTDHHATWARWTLSTQVAPQPATKVS